MKVLHVITSLKIGGAERLLADILPILAKENEISLLVYERVHSHFEEQLEVAGIKILSLEENNFYNPFIIFRMRKIFEAYDVVHAHLFPTLYWAALACRGLKVKLFYTEHSTLNRRRDKLYFRSIERYMYARYDKIISISQQTQDALTKWLKQNDDRFVIIENGVNISHFTSIQKSVIPKSLIMVSRFAPAKDQETVIRAMRYIDSQAILRLVGDGETLEHCKQVAKACNVDNRVFFLGACSNIAELIAESYIGIQSSKWEGFGLTAVEIMACGKPVIATDVEGLRQVVDGAGELFQSGDEIELANIVNRLLIDIDYYKFTSLRCKKRAAMYDIRTMAQKYKDLYYGKE